MLPIVRRAERKHINPTQHYCMDHISHGRRQDHLVITTDDHLRPRNLRKSWLAQASHACTHVCTTNPTRRIKVHVSDDFFIKLQTHNQESRCYTSCSTFSTCIRQACTRNCKNQREDVSGRIFGARGSNVRFTAGAGGRATAFVLVNGVLDDLRKSRVGFVSM
jgi:hypothetical protein